MKCFKCPDVVCRTEYPEGSVQSVCPKCSWRSAAVKIPTKIPTVQSIPLEITPKSNIFDAIYINNGSRVDSMSQIVMVNDCFYCEEGSDEDCFYCEYERKGI